MGFKPSSSLLNSTPLPISLSEFSNALFSTWKQKTYHNGRGPKTFGMQYEVSNRDIETEQLLGLAISGGVDSMALATLCSGLLHNRGSEIASPLPNLAFKAFVVDHGVRNGSDVEAENVSKVLESRGL
jgi:hypothetical protein